MPPPSSEDYKEAIKSIGELHGNMAVLSKLDGILKDYNSELSAAEQLIQSDGALSGSIIKIANSMLYGVGQKIEDIPGALQKVGFQEALKLVSMALSKQVFMRDLDAYGVTADSYWRYSYFVAVFMESQARRLGEDPSDAYLVGLLHCIGRVVINELLHVHEIEMFWDRFVPSSQWEVAMVGFTNEVAGDLLLGNWEFSPHVRRRISNQSNAQQVKADPVQTLLHYAKQLALHLEDDARIEALCAPGAHLYLKRAKLDPAEMRREIEAARAYVDEVYHSLKDC